MDPVYDAEHDDEVRQLRKTMRQRWPVIEKHFAWIFGFTVDGVKLSELQPAAEQHSYTITNTQPNAMVSRMTDMRISVAAPPFSRDESLRGELDQLALIMEKNLTDSGARAEIALFPDVNRGMSAYVYLLYEAGEEVRAFHIAEIPDHGIEEDMAIQQ
ncbi:hypothetical protein CGLO_02266 [Colletotrichum gloeosporioides Cg-14]|uniref:Uncharacterized protein n=1 Tax=Colletotrichum gloeosporioides (strain Cg-14) TaxID=1237896 RepID=T0M9C6_COLGC|nr:hypothetical protein CGLO_02266 [Colletotrichum gloeosporioides Cg-14]